MVRSSDCPLCLPDDPGQLLWHNQQLRVIRVDDDAFPGFTRVIWHAHQPEMTMLSPDERHTLMAAVWVVEATLRTHLQPHKVNLAQLGNQVPHLHWHVIPRWVNDTHYPDAIWAPAQARSAEHAADWVALQQNLRQRLPEYWAALTHALDDFL